MLARSEKQQKAIIAPENAVDAKQSLSSPLSYPLIPEITLKNISTIKAEIDSLDDRLSTGPQLAERLKSKGQPIDYYEAIFAIDDKFEVPAQWVTLTKQLRNDLQEVEKTAQSKAEFEDLLRCIFLDRPEHLTSFSNTAINRYNQLYYSCKGSFTTTPSLFNRVPLIGNALSKLLAELLPQTETLRIKEMCAGVDWENRWRDFTKVLGLQRKVDLTIADYSLPAISRARHSINNNCSISAEVVSPLTSIQPLADENKLHALVCVYGFDSLWFSEDVTLVKKKTSPWCECLYRVAVPDWHPHRLEAMAAFACGDVSKLTIHDLRQLVIERALKPFPLEADDTLKSIITDRVGNTESVQLSVPLGLANYIDRLFKLQMHTDGVVIIGDVGINDPEITAVHDFMTTGVGAKYKSIDFVLAKALLEARGYHTEVLSIEQLLKKTNQSSDPRFLRDAIKNAANNYVMIVQKSVA